MSGGRTQVSAPRKLRSRAARASAHSQAACAISQLSAMSSDGGDGGLPPGGAPKEEKTEDPYAIPVELPVQKYAKDIAESVKANPVTASSCPRYSPPSFFCTTARCRRLDPDEPVSSSVRISRRSSSAIPDQARNLHTACRVLQLFLDSSLSPAVAQRPKLHFSSRNAQVKRRRSLRSCSTRACQAAKPSPSRSLGAWRL